MFGPQEQGQPAWLQHVGAEIARQEEKYGAENDAKHTRETWWQLVWSNISRLTHADDEDPRLTPTHDYAQRLIKIIALCHNALLHLSSSELKWSSIWINEIRHRKEELDKEFSLEEDDDLTAVEWQDFIQGDFEAAAFFSDFEPGFIECAASAIKAWESYRRVIVREAITQ